MTGVHVRLPTPLRMPGGVTPVSSDIAASSALTTDKAAA